MLNSQGHPFPDLNHKALFEDVCSHINSMTYITYIEKDNLLQSKFKDYLDSLKSSPNSQCASTPQEAVVFLNRGSKRLRDAQSQDASPEEKMPRL